MIMAVYSATPPVEDSIHWEDECTVQFEAEEDDVQHRLQGSGIAAGGVIFREYGGEDFSKYLEDDDEVAAVPLTVTGSAQVLEESNKQSARRYQKRQSRKRPDEATTTIGAFDQVESSADSSSTPGSRKSMDGLRERLVQFLPGNTRSKTHRSKSREVNKIQNCSFADLRIGSSLLIEQRRLSAGSIVAGPSASANSTTAQHESDSEIRSTISLETHSDLGFREQRSSWWNLDTLSDRQDTSVVEPNGRPKTRSRGINRLQSRAKSVPDLLDLGELEEGPGGCRSPDSGSSGARGTRGRHMGNVDGGLVNCWDEDLRRQAEQAALSKTASGQSIWKKITHSINKRSRRSKGFEGGMQQLRPPANNVRPPPQTHQQPPPANAMRPPPTPPPNSFTSAGIYDEIRL